MARGGCPCGGSRVFSHRRGLHRFHRRRPLRCPPPLWPLTPPALPPPFLRLPRACPAPSLPPTALAPRVAGVRQADIQQAPPEPERGRARRRRRRAGRRRPLWGRKRRPVWGAAGRCEPGNRDPCKLRGWCTSSFAACACCCDPDTAHGCLTRRLHGRYRLPARASGAAAGPRCNSARGGSSGDASARVQRRASPAEGAPRRAAARLRPPHALLAAVGPFGRSGGREPPLRVLPAQRAARRAARFGDAHAGDGAQHDSRGACLRGWRGAGPGTQQSLLLWTHATDGAGCRVGAEMRRGDADRGRAARRRQRWAGVEFVRAARERRCRPLRRRHHNHDAAGRARHAVLGTFAPRRRFHPRRCDGGPPLRRFAGACSAPVRSSDGLAAARARSPRRSALPCGGRALHSRPRRWRRLLLRLAPRRVRRSLARSCCCGRAPTRRRCGRPRSCKACTAARASHADADHRDDDKVADTSVRAGVAPLFSARRSGAGCSDGMARGAGSSNREHVAEGAPAAGQ